MKWLSLALLLTGVSTWRRAEAQEDWLSGCETRINDWKAQVDTVVPGLGAAEVSRDALGLTLSFLAGGTTVTLHVDRTPRGNKQPWHFLPGEVAWEAPSRITYVDDDGQTQTFDGKKPGKAKPKTVRTLRATRREKVFAYIAVYGLPAQKAAQLLPTARAAVDACLDAAPDAQ